MNKSSKKPGKPVQKRRQSKQNNKEELGVRLLNREISVDQGADNSENTPKLLHPSENIAHTYSFDIGVPHSHKNMAKDNLNSLQQQVLKN
jgi:hypothetical protein